MPTIPRALGRESPWLHRLEGHACPGAQSAGGLLPLSLDKVRQFVRVFDYFRQRGSGKGSSWLSQRTAGGCYFGWASDQSAEKAAVEIGVSAWLVRKIIPPHLCPGNTIQASEMHFHLSPGCPQGDLPNRVQAGRAQVTGPLLRALESQQCLFVLWICHLPGGMLMGPRVEGDGRGRG